MSDFEVFKKHLYDGNLDELRHSYKIEFVDKLIDFSSQKRVIHYASANGFTEIVKFLIDNSCNIESATKTLMRPIHFASKEGHFEVAKLLIENNCDIESETQYKRRPIHLACTSGHADIVKLLVDKNCCLECETQNKRRPIHCACVNGNIDIVKLFIEKKCNLESETQNKWKPIHYACERGHVDVLKLLIENKCDTECESEDKWRPIHCASLNGYTEIVKLLISTYHCDIHCVTNDGNTPLNIAHKQGHVDCLEYLNSVIRDTRKIFDSIKNNDPVAFHELYRYDILTQLEYPTGNTIVDVALQAKADKIIDYLKNKVTEQDEIKYLTKNPRITKQLSLYRNVMECILYRCMLLEDIGGFYRNVMATLINGPHQFMKTSFLELAAETGNGMFLREILVRSLYCEKEWESAKEIALRNGHPEIESDIESRQSLLLSRKKANVSILHTAIYDNNVDMVTYILDNRLVDKNVTDSTFGTGLTLAYSLSQSRVIDALLNYEIDVNIPNKYMQTPMSICMESQLTKNFEYLADRLRNINAPGYMDFTVLQNAVVCGYPDFCESLMRRKANYLVDVEFSKATSLTGTDVPPIKTVLPLSCKENCLTLCIKVQCTIYPCFLNLMNKNAANICDGVGDSLLHLSAKVMNPDLCTTLLDKCAYVNKLNKNGNNALTELINYLSDRTKNEINQENLYKTVEVLLDSGIDDIKIFSNGMNLLHLAVVFNEEKYIVDILKKVPQFNMISNEDFKIGITKNWFNYAELLYSMIPKEDLPSFSLKENIFSCLFNNRSKLTKLLFNNATKKLKQSLIEEMLFQGAIKDNLEIFEYILETEISHPDLMENGQTLLTNLIMENKNIYSILLIQSKSGKNLINLKSSNDNYPIHLAIGNHQLDVVKELIPITDKLNTENFQGKTPAVLLFQKLSDSTDDLVRSELKLLIKLLIQYGGDIYFVSSNGKPVIEECLDSEFLSEIVEFSNANEDNSLQPQD